MKNLIHKSRSLAYLLRHTTYPDRKAWAGVPIMLEELGITQETFMQIIASDLKGRFELSDDNLFVRALYGHSIDVDLGLQPTVPPAILYHGTAEKSVQSIMEKGLEPKSRKYVHLSETVETAIEVGARHGEPVVLSIDTVSMVKDGCKFYKAQRGVWLIDGVPLEYIKCGV